MSIIHKAVALGVAIALGLSISAGSAATSAEPAKAAETNTTVSGSYGCAGNLIDQRKLVSQWGTLYGYLNLYWDGLYNCAVTVHAPGYQGSTLFTSVEIATGDSQTYYDYDGGNYASYAGPVQADGIGRCVRVSGSISGVDAYIPWSHCG